MESFISYEGLPVNSGGAHSLGQKDPETIFLESKEFIQAFTNADNPNEINLTLYSSQKKTYKTLPILWNLTRKFGIPSFTTWHLGSAQQRCFTWRLKPREIRRGFDILKKYKNLPSNPFGPIVLSLKWQFHFIYKDSKKVLPGQDEIPVVDERQKNSQLYLRLGQTSTISAWFTFPFSSIEGFAADYIKSLAEHLPFKPSGKHWKIWHLSKNGNWFDRHIQP